MKFGTSIHCMDGRIQEPIIQYLKSTYKLQYINTITEPGPCKIISDNTVKSLFSSIHRRIHISLHDHASKIIAVSGHYDCAGNPLSRERQIKQLDICERILKEEYPDTTIIKLWINEKFEVEEI